MNTADLLDRLLADPDASGWHDNPEALQSVARDGMLTQQNLRRWASYRIADDSAQSPIDCPQLARLAGLSPDARALLPRAERVINFAALAAPKTFSQYNVASQFG